MAVAFVDGAYKVVETDTATYPTATPGPSSTFTIPRPTAGGALVEGQFLLAEITWDTNAATDPVPTLPSGWVAKTAIRMAGTTSTTYMHGMLVYHFVTAAEAASPPSGWNVTTPAAYDGTVTVVRFSGVDPADPFAVSTPADGDAFSAQSTGVTTRTSASVTTDVPNAMLLAVASIHAASQTLTMTTAGYTIGANSSAQGGRVTAIAYLLQAAAGASGTATWTNGSNASGFTWQTALNALLPASAPTVNAGADAGVTAGTAFTRTATESANGSTITSRAWTIVSGPAGAGSTIGTAAAISWTPSTAGTYVLRYTATNSVGSGADDLTLTVSSAGPPPGTFVSAWTGDPDGSSAPINVKTSAAASVRLKVGTNSAVTTGVTFTAATVPDSAGYASFLPSGLTPGSDYWYQPEVDGVLAAEIGSFTTDTPAQARSGRIALGSCLASGTTTRTAFDNLIANDPDLFIHHGDLQYGDSLSTDATVHRGLYESQIAANGGLRDVLRKIPTVYLESDHDSGVNDWTGGPGVQTPAWLTAIAQVMPHRGLPAGGIYRAVHFGRVKFILTDCRSYKSPASATDNASKTMFGTTQEAWIANQLADPAYPVKVICMDVPWVYPTTAGDDKWGGYTAAANRLVADIASTGARVLITHGDAHSLCADDGSSPNNRGGLPVVGAAPFGGKTTSIKGGPYSQGTWPTSANIGTVKAQHGLLDITDTGTAITLRYSGRDDTNIERVTLTTTYDLAAAPVPVVDRWNGTTLVRQRSDRWNGTALVQQTITT